MMKRTFMIISLTLVIVGICAVGFSIFHSSGSKKTDQADSTEDVPEKTSGLKGKDNRKTKTENNQAIESSLDNTEKPNTNKRIAELLKTMTLEEKVGQMMVVGFPSTEVDANAKKMIEDYHVGGIILFDRNMETPEQVTALNADLQDLALQSTNKVPLIISVDQEGGEIVRMRDQVTPIPSQQKLGAAGDKEEIYATAKHTGMELADMGFNVNFAPVLDLSATDTRSFGEDPKKTYQFGKQVLEGFADSSITGTLKHFPGNGRSTVDPHVDSSSVDAEKGDLENGDIYPFKKMIEEVDQSKYFTMVTHLIYPAYDKERPASISPVIIKDLLREQLGYEGIVVTDDLEMGAVSNLYSYEELGYRAVNAGANLLLVCHTLESQEKVYNGILHAVENGKISENEIDDAVERILRFKLQD
ncbi:beta-N-acetylhexosaminidase [Lentibacillus sp. N15]|uniref:beta-N-acetylhexosaminidase n=1 Tax=Lentibacillus songyuanensis TaxID=3136161 RepID=UPI0031B9F63B